MKLLTGVALLATIALPAAGQQRQQNDDFTWSGKVSTGRWIRVKNLNGGITVGQATGDNVEVTATKRWRRGDPSVVRFDVQKGSAGQDVLICALWGERSSCDDRGYETRGDRSTRNNDVNVTFRVLVPKGVKVGIYTINGAVAVEGMSAEVEAESVNGEIEVETTGGPVNATTVNGSVRARVGRIDNNADMQFTTVNGSVIAEFSGDVGADVEMSTVNGGLRTDYEITVTGRLDPKHLRAHIGRPGGPRIKLETVNGSVELRRR